MTHMGDRAKKLKVKSNEKAGKRPGKNDSIGDDDVGARARTQGK